MVLTTIKFPIGTNTLNDGKKKGDPEPRAERFTNEDEIGRNKQNLHKNKSQIM